MTGGRQGLAKRGILGRRALFAPPYNLPTMTRYDVAIRGVGPVGRTLALSLARQGLRVALVATTRDGVSAMASTPSPDIRTYALNAASVALLQSLKVWAALPADAATPVQDMWVYGGQASQGTAPEAALRFSAWQQKVDALAWIVDAGALDQVLAQAVTFAPHITTCTDRGDAPGVDADLTVYAEGKDAPAWASLGVTVDRHDYGHTAVAARVVSQEPHGGLARQWFRSPDILALLPFDRPRAGHSYGLVWSAPAAQAARLMAMSDGEFEAELALACGAPEGCFRLEGARGAWPLRLQVASTVCGPAWALVGDAAHVVHPLAGQGLNLGLADVISLSQVIADRETWRNLGDPKLLRRYERARFAPTRAMGAVTDGLLHLFAAPQPWVQTIRQQGMRALDQLSPLKQWLTARALHS